MFITARMDSVDTVALGTHAQARSVHVATAPVSKAERLEAHARQQRSAADAMNRQSILLGAAGVGAGALKAGKLAVGLGLAAAASRAAAQAHAERAAEAEKQAAAARASEQREAERAAADKAAAEKAAADAKAARERQAQNEQAARDFGRDVRHMRGDTYGGRASSYDRARSDRISVTC